MAYTIPVETFSTDNYKIQREITNTGATHVEIKVVDPRNISKIQRRKAWAILGDISRWSGHPADYLHDILKQEFCLKHLEPYFSLSNVDVTVARKYITYLIDFCLYYDVPLHKPVLDMCDDLEAAVYSCLARRKCLVCGLKADIHHVDAIGMGRDRAKTIHEGMRTQPLCRKHHSECHIIGQNSFDDKYHTISLPLDRYLCTRLGLKTVAN